jgi:hypothetical protein
MAAPLGRPGGAQFVYSRPAEALCKLNLPERSLDPVNTQFDSNFSIGSTDTSRGTILLIKCTTIIILLLRFSLVNLSHIVRISWNIEIVYDGTVAPS